MHEVINGLMQVPKERRPRLGVVPVGSGNDFAFAVGLDRRSDVALHQVFTGIPKKVDIMILRDDLGRCEYAGNTVGIGFDATVNIRSRNVPVVHGFLLYLAAVFQTIMLNHEAPLMQVKTDQEAWEARKLMLTLCNGPREGGGFRVAPDAKPDDGWLDYLTIQKVSRPMMLRLLVAVMQGKHVHLPQVKMGRFRKLEMSADRPFYIHTDGEIFAGFGVNVRQITLEIVPAAIDVVVPA